MPKAVDFCLYMSIRPPLTFCSCCCLVNTTSLLQKWLNASVPIDAQKLLTTLFFLCSLPFFFFFDLPVSLLLFRAKKISIFIPFDFYHPQWKERMTLGVVDEVLEMVILFVVKLFFFNFCSLMILVCLGGYISRNRLTYSMVNASVEILVVYASHTIWTNFMILSLLKWYFFVKLSFLTLYY